MDVLAKVLDAVHLSGTVLFHAQFGAPFSYGAPPSEQFASMLVPHARRLMIFHLVLEGKGVAFAGGETLEVNGGDVILLPRGDGMVLSDRVGAAPQSIFAALPPPPWSEAPRVSLGGEAPGVRVVCGFLHADEAILAPLLADLPTLMVLQARQTLPRLETMLSYTLDEMRSARPGGSSLLNRLAEVLFIEVLRQVLLDGQHSTLLAALRDPVVGRSLTALHEDPARPWTIGDMARAAASSRSLVAERFRALVGCPPIEYLTRWRMQLAAHRLRGGRDSIAAIAETVGYSSESAFNRAFRRYLGETPAAWRRQQRG